MIKKIATLALCVTVIAANGQSKRGLFGPKKAKADTAAVKKETDYDKLLKDKHETKKGMITQHTMKGQLYFEFPVSLFNKEMLLGSTVSEISDNGDAVIGSKPTDPLHIMFTKVGEKINIINIQKDYISDSKNPDFVKAIDKSTAGAVIKSFKMKTYNNDSTAVVFEVTDFFVGDNKLMSPFDKYGLNTAGGRVKRMEMYQSDKSFLGEVKSFDNNISVRSHLSYKYTLTYNGRELAKDVPFTAVMTRSIMLLDDQPYRPRITDSRMAIFPTGKYLFSDNTQQTKIIYYANRWRVEPSDEEAYRSGKLVEPKKPIVFYIDNSFPEDWKPFIFTAVEQWNEPFEKIGFKNAVVAREFPTDDPEFDPDNIKYSCIRYAPLRFQNAMGPSWVDPRSGEILSASVYVYHDVVKLINNWRFIQTAQADADVRSGKLPLEILGDGLRYVIAHEVGHCLGLMHNMSASSVIPVDSLRSPAFTAEHGTTTSIMDYARFNYVAQPGDKERGVKLTPPRFGDYDYFTIKWSYTPIFGGQTALDDYATTSKWLTEAAANPVYRYGKQQFTGDIDPKSLSEDLGDDAMKASAYGIKNLKYILSNLNGWTKGLDKDFEYRTDIYTGIIYQYVGYISNVFANVGGLYLNEKMEGDPVDAIRPVSRERQKDAFKFICDQYYDLDWMDNKDLMQNIQLMGSARRTLQAMLAQVIVYSSAKIASTEQQTRGARIYTPAECAADIYNLVWGPTMKGKALTEGEMMLQREYMVAINRMSGLKYTGGGAVPSGITDNDVQIIEMPDFLRDYDNQHRNLCYCCEHSHSKDHLAKAANPTAGYEPPFAMLQVPKSYEADNYAYLLKVQQLLRSRVAGAPAATRSHYTLILRNIEKALK